MSGSKKTQNSLLEKQEINIANSEKSNATTQGAEKIEKPRRQFHERVVFSTTFLDQIDLLAQTSLEFQQIVALYKGLIDADTSNFSQVKKNALNIIDTCFDLYRKPFSLPDELVNLPIDCGKDGRYYLSLHHGYLCFYTNPEHLCPTPIVLVIEPPNQEKPRSN